MALPTVQTAGANIEGMSRLPLLRQLGFMIGLAAAVAIGVAVVLWSQQPTFTLLYSNLSEKDAANVIDALDKSKIPYQLGGQGAVLIPADKVHDTRIKLAAQGLPRGNAVGFESLSENGGFGVSQFMENARYQRSLEVELSRSISTLANVESARVHLAIPKRSVFLRDRQKPSASVLVNLYGGRRLEEEQVAAITHLVSSSIPELDPAQVTIVDQRGHLLTEKNNGGDMALTAAQFDYTQKIERTYAQRVEELLAPIVGKESVRAQVATEIDFTVAEKTEETFNPDTPVVRSEQLVQERVTNGSDGGIPGALSNQPPGAAQAPEKAAAPANAANASAEAAVNSKQRSVKNYELDRTISHTRLGTGVLKRLSVAVVIDDKIAAGPNGATIRTRYSPEDIERFSALVKEAVGFNEKRGDSVSVINAAFSTPAAAEPLPAVPLWQRPDFWDKVKQGFGWALAALLVFGVLRVMGQIGKTLRESRPALQSAGAGGEMREDQLMLSQQAAPLKIQAPQNATLDSARDFAKQDPKLVAQVVKGWVASDG
jgi:flagellar M-ring protein FliF